MREVHPERDQLQESLVLLARPNPMESDKSYDRFYHHDLAGLDEVELFREAMRAEIGIARARDADAPWFFERLAAIRGELASRGLALR